MATSTSSQISFQDLALQDSARAFTTLALFSEYVYTAAWGGVEGVQGTWDDGVVISTPNGSLDNSLTIRQITPRTLESLLIALTELGLVFRINADHKIWLSGKCAHPLNLASTLLERFLPHHDLRWHVLHAIRRYRRVAASATTARWFGALAEYLNTQREGGIHWKDSPTTRIPLSTALRREGAPKNATRHAAFFLDVSRMIYDLPHLPWHKDSPLPRFDVERLLTIGFALPTGIRGLDYLLGGGLLLPEVPVQGADPDPLPGRVILIQGRPGTGKTLLSLEMAVKVARAGGLAWIFPLEQPASEYQYMLDSMRLLADGPPIDIAVTPEDAARLMSGSRRRGALIIVSTVRDSSQDFLKSLENFSDATLPYPLRLLVADPINTVNPDTNSLTMERHFLSDTLRRLKEKFVNVILVSERNHDDSAFSSQSAFEENISDAVIRLTMNSRHNYSYRALEMRKSRLQREFRGEHPFSIQPGTGLWVYPSPAAILSGLDQGHWHWPPQFKQAGVQKPRTVQYGVDGMDKLLGENAIHSNEVVLLRGPAGSYKTPLGLRFLLNDLTDDKRALLFTPDAGEASLEQQLRRAIAQTHPTENYESVRKRIKIFPLPLTHVTPGYLLMRLRYEIEQIRAVGMLERVMLDGLLRLERSAPFIHEDKTFPETMIALLRSAHITSLLVCEDSEDGDVKEEFHLQDALERAADVTIHMERLGAREGHHSVRVWVRRTPGTVHKPGKWEVRADDHGISMIPANPLYYEDMEGIELERDVMLFLHCETSAQRTYNDTLADLLHRRGIETEWKEPETPPLWLELPAAEAKQVQILQIDEPVLPLLKDHLWDDALPYYDNVSLLAFDVEMKLSQATLGDWYAVAEKCRTAKSDEVFFEYPRTKDEDLCSLFLEILLGTLPYSADEAMIQLKSHWPMLNNWLAVRSALMLFRDIARPAYIKHPCIKTGKSLTPSKNIYKATLWRHWYTTLEEMTVESPEDAKIKERLHICALPKTITVSGEWFLGIPNQSAVPEVADRILRCLVTPQQQVDRFGQGVGLPFFEKSSSSIERREIGVSGLTYTSMGAFVSGLTRLRRSELKLYSILSPLLARMLRTLLELPDYIYGGVETKVEELLMDFGAQVEVIGRTKGLEQ